jgi:hypothetical protein
MIDLADEVTAEAAVAIHRRGSRWSLLARCCRSLDGRLTVHRIAAYDVRDEPPTLAGFAVLQAIVRQSGDGLR